MSNFKYSVLIPCYRTDPVLLKRCLESITSQNRSDVEIVLVEALLDGCSSYQKTAISDPLIHYYVSDRASAPYQRNMTLQKAQGDYLVFVDSDDYVSPRFFEFADKTLFAHFFRFLDF